MSGHAKSPEDLHSHRCVTVRHPTTGKLVPWTFQRGKKIVAIDVIGTLTTNDTDTQRQAVLQGIGIGQLASFFAFPHLEDGSLQPLLMNYVAPPIDIFLCMANRKRTPKRINALFDFLDERLRRHPDFQPRPLRN
jgi:DNA-binding transcriptional LysR family regulator